MLIAIEETVHLAFSTRNPETGNVSDADALPTAAVYEESSVGPMAVSVTVTELTATGQYMASVACTSASSFGKGKKYTIRVNATVGGVTDEAPIGTFEISGLNHGVVIDTVLSDLPGGVWAYTDTISASKTAFEVLCMAAAGAGAGTVDIGGHTPGATRLETFRYPNGDDAYVVTVDAEGERTSVNLNP